MTNTIKLKRGSGSDPSASDMVVGEPVLRSDTAELFFKKDDGSVAKVSGGGGGGSSFQYLALRNAANDGAASYPGNDFTLVTSGTTTAVSPATANALILSYGGVVQKPNSGTSTSGITGFIVDGSRLKTATNFAAAPDFIVYQESGGIGEPSDNTVTSAKIVDGAIVNADINASAAIAFSKLATTGALGSAITATTQSANDNSTKIATTAYADTAISNLVDSSPSALNTLNELAAALGDDANFSTTVTNSIATKLPLAGGTLTGNVIHNDSVKALFGTSSDLQVYHDGTRNIIDAATSKNTDFYYGGSQQFWFGNAEFKGIDNKKIILGTHDDLQLYHDPSTNNIINNAGSLTIQKTDGDKYIHCSSNAAVELYHDNFRSLNTTDTGIHVWGPEGTEAQIYMYADDGDDADDKWKLKADYVASGFYIQNYKDGAWEDSIRCFGGGATELFHNNSKKFFTTSTGVSTTGRLNQQVNSSTTFPTSFGTNAYNPYDHELVIDNNTQGNEGSFAGIYFNAGADSDGSKVGTARISAVETGNYKADLVFGTRNTSFTEKFRIEADGDFRFSSDTAATNYGWIRGWQPSTGDMIISADHSATGTGTSKSNLIFRSRGQEKLRILSGGGITFNGDTAAANALDDYEEGTFTPEFSHGATASGYSYQKGYYTKVGNKVFATFYLRANAGVSTNGNDLRISGLPFTSNSTAQKEGGGFLTYTDGFFGTTAEDYTSSIWIPNASAYLVFYQKTDGVSIKGNDCTVNLKYVIGQITYTV